MRLSASVPTLSLAAALVALAAAGCGGPATPAFGPDVWAVVDGRPIRQADVELAYRAAVQPSQEPPPAEELLATQLTLLDELITQDILGERARTSGLQVTDAEVDQAFAERKGDMTDAAMSLQLAQRNLTIDDVKSVLRRELLVQKVLDRDVTEKAAVTDEEITAFFEQNRARFNLSEAQYRIAQIVVTPQRDAQIANRLNDDATTPDEARRKAEMVFERLRGGADFQQLAADYSEDPQSAPSGGDLGFIPESSLKQAPAALRDLVLKMEPGNVNTVVINGAYTIVLLVAHEPAGQRDLTMPGVKDTIRDGLRERRDRLLRTAYLAEARSGATVDNRIARSVIGSQGKPPAGIIVNK
ncbi:MAG: peptidylprolyl isomerase [Vicinamibacterales bacterium]